MKILIGFILFFVLLYMLAKPVREIINAIGGQTDNHRYTQKQNNHSTTSARKPREDAAKDDIVPDGAGEYVDFEEIKEDKK